MDRQLAPPLRLEPVSSPHAMTTSDAHTALSNYLGSLPSSSTSRSQLERLVDSLGVDLGLIEPDESNKREEKRREARATRRAERRKERERVGLEGMEKEVEGLAGGEGGGDKEEVDMDEGAVGLEGEEGMQDRGDVEYGDVESADGDEPDEEDEGQEKMDVDADEE
ncbi:uncharacterized protein MKK02DRAFT_40746 [Dioszegia hungarica]|uniref:Uncharacterized protein n=1 Tax=Dioszegia hungarica TaxID=4972 RepID=A0AA38LRI6_9TREE|nr:uncharacterized protein MKK02DRAFT_40746 [Dioszegia hungarica]KAI9632443.1 hypothetical protein MKK02DRAFT_40746 [Dioszegia hungarica]